MNFWRWFREPMGRFCSELKSSLPVDNDDFYAARRAEVERAKRQITVKRFMHNCKKPPVDYVPYISIAEWTCEVCGAIWKFEFDADGAFDWVLHRRPSEEWSQKQAEQLGVTYEPEPFTGRTGET